jgi:predicted tellurium resistance membrane protein TerC
MKIALSSRLHMFGIMIVFIILLTIYFRYGLFFPEYPIGKNFALSYLVCSILILIGTAIIVSSAEDIIHTFSEGFTSIRWRANQKQSAAMNGGRNMESPMMAFSRRTTEWISRNHLLIGKIFIWLGVGIAIILIALLMELIQAIFLIFAIICLGIGYEMLARYLKEACLGMDEYVKLRLKEEKGFDILGTLKEK